MLARYPSSIIHQVVLYPSKPHFRAEFCPKSSLKTPKAKKPYSFQAEHASDKSVLANRGNTAIPAVNSSPPAPHGVEEAFTAVIICYVITYYVNGMKSLKSENSHATCKSYQKCEKGQPLKMEIGLEIRIIIF